MRILLLFPVICLGLAGADLLDRIAVTVGTHVITEGEVLDEIRVTAFLNGQQPDFSVPARRQGAERLVDQYLIRQEMELSGFAQPPAEDAKSMLEQLRSGRYISESDLESALQQYGISRPELEEHLRWQLAALRFTDIRFGAAMQSVQPMPEQQKQALTNARQEAARETSAAGGPPEGTPGSPPEGNAQRANQAERRPLSVDERMDAWLQNARKRTRVEFRPEAFQ